MFNKTIVIGIAGGTGSGKTTLAKKIKEEFNDKAILLCHDFYYKSNDNLPFEKRCKLNFDHPNAFDTDLLISNLISLKNNVAIDCPIYSFVEHTRLKEKIHIEPQRIILVEGILIFENKALCDLMDIKVYVDTDSDVRLIRRLLRDVDERGRDLNSVITQYLTTVKPMHEQFVEPSKKKADIIIPEGGYNKVAISMLLEQIRSFLSCNQ